MTNHKTISQKLVKPKRKCLRLENYDYASAGYYYVTICSQDRKCLFGKITNGKMALNNIGKMINQWWLKIWRRFNNVELDVYQIMPNHIHGIIVINELDNKSVGAGFPRPQTTVGNNRSIGRRLYGSGYPTPTINKPTLGQIVAYFKYQSTKQINTWRRTPGKHLWQRNYYEHVVRKEDDLNKIRQYIVNNRQGWDRDRNNPTLRHLKTS